MRRKMMFLSFLLGALAGGAVDGGASSSSTAVPVVVRGISLELGRQDYRNYCAACHGVGGTGDGTIAEFLTIAAPDLTRLAKLNAGIYPRDKVAHVVDGRLDVKVHGTRDMPVWGDWFNSEAIAPDIDRETRKLIVRERIESLVNYVETLQMN